MLYYYLLASTNIQDAGAEMSTLISRTRDWWSGIFDELVENFMEQYSVEELTEIANCVNMPDAMVDAANAALELLEVDDDDEEDADVMDGEPTDGDDQLVAPTSIEGSDETTAQLQQPKKTATKKKATRKIAKKKVVKKKAIKKKTTKKKKR